MPGEGEERRGEGRGGEERLPEVAQAVRKFGLASLRLEEEGGKVECSA